MSNCRRPSDESTRQTAHEMEELLEQLAHLPDVDAARRKVEARLLDLVRPFIERVAEDTARTWEGEAVADLVQEGQLVVLQRLREQGFRPGAAGAGKSAFPAWVMQVAKQAMAREASARRSPVHVTDHARKALRKARKQAKADGSTLVDALSSQGMDASTTFALGDGTVHATMPVEELLGLADSPEGRDRYVQQGRAMVALHSLPRLQRLAVSAAVGVGQPEGRPQADRTLASVWRVEVREVRRLREAGLRRLRRMLGAVPCP